MVETDNSGQTPRDNAPITRLEMKEFIDLTLKSQDQRLDEQHRRIEDLRKEAEQRREDTERSVGKDIGWIKVVLSLLFAILFGILMALAGLLIDHFGGHVGP